jgi:quinol monooxygenase YgiN
VNTLAKFAIVGTIKTAPGKRDEYLKHLTAHAQRCLATEPGTLKFEILVPTKEADTVMLCEVYANSEAFKAHWTGASMPAGQTGLGQPASNERGIPERG